MGSAEFGEWQAFYASEPWGEMRGDLQMAQLLSLLANINRDARKQTSPFTVAQFMVDFWQEPAAPPEPGSLAAKFKALTMASHNGE